MYNTLLLCSVIFALITSASFLSDKEDVMVNRFKNLNLKTYLYQSFLTTHKTLLKKLSSN